MRPTTLMTARISELAGPIRTALLAACLLGTGAAEADDDPSALSQLPGVGDGADCVAQCDTVYAGCLQQCEGSVARRDSAHYDVGDVPLGQCIEDCRSDLKICREDC